MPSPTFCAAIDDTGDAVYYDGSTWHAPTIYSNDTAGNAGFGSVSCTSSTFCVVLGGTGNTYIHNGSAWTQSRNLGPNEGHGGKVTCTRSGFCAAANGTGVSVFTGSTWSPPTDIDPTGLSNALDAISCPSSNFCMAGGGNAFFDLYNGSSWDTPTRMQYELSAVSCPTDTFCIGLDGSNDSLTNRVAS